jgi:hypothetical protein
MVFLPSSRVTRNILADAKTLIPFAALYTVLLVASWNPDSLQVLLPGSWDAGMDALKAGKMQMQFIPTIDGVGKILSEPLAALSAWAHLQFINFFCARWIWMNGANRCLNCIAHELLLRATSVGTVVYWLLCGLSTDALAKTIYASCYNELPAISWNRHWHFSDRVMTYLTSICKKGHNHIIKCHTAVLIFCIYLKPYGS